MTTKRQIVTVVSGGLLFIVLLGFLKYLEIAAAIEQHTSMKMPPEAVTAAETQAVVWPRTIGATGALASSRGVTLGAEAAGKVTRIAFASGQAVGEGEVLVELDTTVEEAQLRGAEALRDSSRQALARAQSLRQRNANSTAELERAEADFRAAEAAVDSLRATIARKKVIAPFAGRTGIRSVNLGQFVEAGAPIVPLHMLDPLYVNFAVPQQSLGRLASGQPLAITVDAFPGERFTGTITTVNPNVDDRTRNVAVQATVPNPGERLRPGMFVNVEVTLPDTDRVIAVPISAVNFAPYGDSVWVIEQMTDPAGETYNGVRQQIVKLGGRRGEQVAVTAGLTAGQRIVTSGTFKLRPGVAVAEHDTITPGNSAAPAPVDS